ncbi:permease [Cohnella endophytica]|uniref:Permease n=1 Tax=Cohnella endophytica TaxID=2419778 RepID=A0A494Y808_9BACL|nr:permease [Cohnella endophytica]RKP58223.1 permease [Cohnella endophytica]
MNATFGIVIAFIVLFSLNPSLISNLSFTVGPEVHTFKTMLISIVLEALPFLLLGVFVSSFMHVFIPEAWFRKMIPRNPYLGVLVACLLGIVFPICECGLIPIVRRLVSKGMPLYAGVVFILVGPIVNPIVFSATFNAFRTKPEMVYARMGLAIAVGAVIGLIIYYFVKINPIRISRESINNASTHTHSHSCSRFVEMLEHAGGEFFDMGKFLIFGSLITAAIQAFVPRSDLVNIGQGEFGSHFFMMGFAFILSLCSTSDAFVASSFASTFSAGSLLTFLVFGPMLDFKSTLMLLSLFKIKFVLFLAGLIAITVFIGAWMLGNHYLN